MKCVTGASSGPDLKPASPWGWTWSPTVGVLCSISTVKTHPELFRYTYYVSILVSLTRVMDLDLEPT